MSAVRRRFPPPRFRRAPAARVFAAALAAAIFGAAFAPAVVSAWTRPVPGAVSRAFDYVHDAPFAAGRHRGVDFAAAPGDVVHAACSGVVVFAGREDVTLRCGGWRVTHLPLATLAVRAGRRVRAGARLGTLAASTQHRGLHLGVRRAGDRFGYVDPLPFLRSPRRPVPLVRTGPRAPRDEPAPSDPAPPARPRASAPARVRVPDVAPWPVWLGLATLLCGAVGGGLTVRVRRLRAAAQPVPSRA